MLEELLAEGATVEDESQRFSRAPQNMSSAPNSPQPQTQPQPQRSQTICGAPQATAFKSGGSHGSSPVFNTSYQAGENVQAAGWQQDRSTPTMKSDQQSIGITNDNSDGIFAKNSEVLFY